MSDTDNFARRFKDETTDFRGILPTAPPPLTQPFLVLEADAQQRLGGHWKA